ncbi:MAG: photosystem reaction center subunit H [Bdellovibrionales bacterium RIFOXYB1_FULL_37_110]|nr:MAG: photosystem reaction center subunit H [Bdellovibrionales bacterium RIFOXYC1_FULL_37_79]OFZ57334.1 MAG: photosystem reaction center subunit H [Bdellovibrionales bacterium RIFOXYB1_FULL_37_110]OFZ62230.1 MAG: photosystem reaction center subunit H [Bdellovibrionales bacterium RIFOXYD1_FULL_36_51]
MLNNAKTLQGYKLASLDGEIGTVKEFYFDDHHWTIRYLVVDTGDWLSSKLVLISPHALRSVNKEKETIEINLTKKQIEDCPSPETDKPVSRQFEEQYHGYFGWPMYWNIPNSLGNSHHVTYDPETQILNDHGSKPFDLHLRSTRDVGAHHIQATDGEIGHVDDFIINTKTWAIRYLIIDTHNWLPGKKVLISPDWIDHVSWVEEKVYIDRTQKSIHQCPEFTTMSLITRDFEQELHQHFKRPESWTTQSHIN